MDLDARFVRGRKAVTLRVVGIWDASALDYHWHVTSLDAEDFPSEEVAELYRQRWQIELLFKEWKSVYRIDQISSGKEPVVLLCLVYASLCAAILSRIAMRFASRRYAVPLERMCVPVDTKILAAMVMPLGFALCRDRACDLRPVVAPLLDAIAIHATLSNPSHILATASRQAA